MSIQVIADEADKKRAGEREAHRRRRIDRTEIRSRRGPAFDAEDLAPWRFKWVNSKERGVRHAVDGLGFELVKQDDVAVPPFAKWDEALGGYRLGEDLLLAKEPISAYEDNRAESAARGDRLAEAAVEDSREKLNKIARDEGRGPAHTDVTFSDSTEGPAEIRVRRRNT